MELLGRARVVLLSDSRNGAVRISNVVLRFVYEYSIVLMADPNWKNGFYYDGMPPHTGMKLARRTSPQSTHCTPPNASLLRNCDYHLPLRARMGHALRPQAAQAP